LLVVAGAGVHLGKEVVVAVLEDYLQVFLA
jgi:hypothetical protein